MAVLYCGGENENGSQNSSRNMQSTHAVLENGHTEILIVHTYHWIARTLECTITLLLNTVRCRNPKIPASLNHEPQNLKSFSHDTVLKLVNSSSSTLQVCKAQHNSDTDFWFSRFMLVPSCLLCSSPNCTASTVSCQHTGSVHNISAIVEWTFRSCYNQVEMLYDGMEGSPYPQTSHLWTFRKVRQNKLHIFCAVWKTWKAVCSSQIFWWPQEIISLYLHVRWQEACLR